MELRGGLHKLHRWGNALGDAPLDLLPSKRKRGDFGDCAYSGAPQEPAGTNGNFVHIRGEQGVYCSESWAPNGSTLYLPVSGSLLANMAKYDQISFEQGLFFIGDSSGGFQQKAQGQALHCWRYSKQEKKLFIALSYFFTNPQIFQDVVNSLSCL